MKKIVNIYLQGAFYLLAGVNHFRDPSFYLGLIPNYLPWSDAINLMAGLAEMALGLGLFFPRSRKIASWGIVYMLIAFIPSHIYFIQIGGCVHDGLCVPLWVGWARLLVIHPILIFWAWMAGKFKTV